MNSKVLVVLLCWVLSASVRAQELDTLPRLSSYVAPPASFVLDRALPVTVHVEGDLQLLLGMESGQLRLVFEDSDAEVLMPLTAPGFYLSYALPENYTELMAWEAQGRHAQIVAEMKGYAEPLMSFLMIEAERCNFHSICFRYFHSLVEVGELSAAVELVRKTPSSAFVAPYDVELIRLVDACVEDQLYLNIEYMMSLLFVVMNRGAYVEYALRVARCLRAQGAWASAQRIYGSIAFEFDGALRNRCLAWVVYCGVEIGDQDVNADWLSLLESVEFADPALGCLVRGRVAMASEDWQVALRELSRAMVVIPDDADYVEEVFVQLIGAYQRVGMVDSADAVADEYSLLYPQGTVIEHGGTVKRFE